MPSTFSPVGLIWLLFGVGGLIFCQAFLARHLHRAIQAIFLLITRRNDLSLVLFSLIFAPGVLMHEASHYLMALLLQVRTGKFSLIPRPLPDGRLQLGFVETSQVDFVRDAMIGAAPLLAGGGFVAYVGLDRLALLPVWDAFAAGDIGAFLRQLWAVPDQPDFWLWFYLGFAVSSTMLPSPSDRRAWLPLALVLLFLVGLALLSGAGPWMIEHLAPIFEHALNAFALTLGISLALHLALLLPVWAIQRLLSRLTGLQVT